MKKDFDPFQVAIEETRRKEAKVQKLQQQQGKHGYSQQRGRERTISASSSSCCSKYQGAVSSSWGYFPSL